MIDGYTFIRKDRKSGPGGEVGCYINNDLQWQRKVGLSYLLEIQNRSWCLLFTDSKYIKIPQL